MRFAGRLTPEQFWDRIHSGHDRIRAGVRGWTLYGLDGWTGPRVLADAGWSGDQGPDGPLTKLGLAHGFPDGWHPYVTVHLTTEEPRDLVAQLRMISRATTGHYADPHELFLEQPGAQAEICVQGRPRPFDLWRQDGLWFATPTAGQAGHGLVVEGRAVEPAWVNLVALRDLEPYLAGYEARLRLMRGEGPGPGRP